VTFNDFFCHPGIPRLGHCQFRDWQKQLEYQDSGSWDCNPYWWDTDLMPLSLGNCQLN